MARVAHLGILLATACTLVFTAPVLAQSSGGSSSGGSSSGGSSAGSVGGSSSGGIGGSAGGSTTGGLSGPAQGGVNTSVPGSAAGGSAAAPSLDANGTARAQTGASGTAGSATSSGPAGAAQRQGDPRCAEVLAHQDSFTTSVVQACQGPAGATGTPTARRDLSTGTLGAGIQPVDRAAEVQKQVEGSDNKAVNGICTNCK